MTTHSMIPFPLTDKILELAGIVAALVLIIIPFAFYDKLPDEIPTHFGINGTPDGFAPKATIWGLPVVGLILWLGLTLLNYFVIMKNDLNPSQKNKLSVAREKVLRLMQIIKLMLSMSFAFILWKTIQVSLGTADGLGVWFLPAFIVVLTFLPIVFLISAVGKSKKNSSSQFN